jgi:hypothetical protein
MTNSNTWKQTSGNEEPGLFKVSNNIFACIQSYTGTICYVKTFNIADTGVITKSYIDTLTLTGAYNSNPFFSYLGNNIYCLSVQGTDSNADGWIKTFSITSSGDISCFEYDSLEFDTADSITYAPILPVANDYYLIVYEGTGNDGWSCTVKIENSTNTTIRQTNANFSAASTKYWWSVNTSDGVQWTNQTYSFTTAGGGEPQTAWHVLDQSINGSIHNNTGSWKVISNSINGSIYNASTNTWRTISQSINGSIYNNTGSWKRVNSAINGSIFNNTGTWRRINYDINGSIYNSSTNTWRVISNTINGSIFNASTNTWKVVSNTINGSIYNSTGAWKVISSSINGSIYNNTGVWKVINNAINGSIYNISTVGWTVISNTINGSIFNNTGAWHIISQSINGSIYNTSILSWYVISSSINGSIYNLSGIWHVISSSINGSIYNSSGTWKVLSNTINGSIFNSSASAWHIISSSINGSIFNKTGAWKVISNTINGSIYNNSGTWHVISSNINGSIYNASTTGLIQITNPIPANNSINNLIPITLSITISNDDGNDMNITWWWGNSSANATHYLGSTFNVANGTYSMAIPGANVTSTYYWWRVNVSDFLSNYENESFRFKTSATSGGVTIITGGRDRFIMGLVIGSMVFLVLGFVLFRRKRRR